MVEEEILQKLMEEYVPNASRYISCIRIDGKPLLPPLIHEEYRAELLRYKNLALLVEKKLNAKKLLINSRLSVDSGIITCSTNEPSWLNPCTLSSDKNAPVTPVFDERVTVHCELPKSQISENTLSKTLICNDDVWRYLSKCSNEYSNVHCDIQECTNDIEISKDINNLEEIQMDASSQNISFYKSFSGCMKNEELGKSPSFFHGEDEQSLPCERRNAKMVNEDNTTIGDASGKEESCKQRYNEILETSSHNNICLNVCKEDKSLGVSDLHSENEMCCDTNCEGAKTSVLIMTDSEPEEENFTGSFHELSSKSSETMCYKTNYDFTSHNPTVPQTVENILETSTSKICPCLDSVNCNGNTDNVHEICEVLNKYNTIAEHFQNKDDKYFLTSHNVNIDDEKAQKMYNPLLYCSGEDFLETTKSNNFLSKNDSGRFSIINDVNTMVLGQGNISENCDVITQPSADKDAEFSKLSHCPVSYGKELVSEVSLSESNSEMDFPDFSVASASLTLSKDTSEMSNISSGNKIDDFTTPKLIRQNSYTLIAPSPILIAHAKATENLETKILSEVDNSVPNHIKSGRKSWDVVKAKTDWNVQKGVKYIFAVPCRQSFDASSSGYSSKLKDKESEEIKVSHLPSSSTASSLKHNSYFCSVSHLPMASIRKFQKYICGNINSQQQPCGSSSDLHPFKEQGIVTEKSLFSTFLSNIDCDKISALGRSINCESKSSDVQGSKSTENSQKNKSFCEQTNSEENHTYDCLTNIEETYKCTSFGQSSTNLLDNCDDGVSEKHYDRIESDVQISSLHSSNTMPNICDKNNVNKPSFAGEPDCSKSLNSSLCDSSIQHIFLQLQNQHSLLMTQLLDRQKKEQETLANTFLNQQRQILQEMRLIPTDPPIGCETSSNSKHVPLNEQVTSESSQHDQHHSMNSQALEFNDSQNSEITETHKKLESDVLTAKDKSGSSFSQEIAFSCDSRDFTEEQMRAATIINAAARGYLTRRLLKTEYVQEIIKTISESVLCALQLQRECPVDITPSDVELHRRLIQQLTAACYSLHETFFSLSTEEKMNIIGGDREKRRLQISRPVSARSAISAATQKYLQRKQLGVVTAPAAGGGGGGGVNGEKSERRPSWSARRSWWLSRSRSRVECSRIASAGEAPRWLPRRYPAASSH